ncbi:hypothetical protein HK104_008957, partial [Borealophlyctis nickersoniae]
GKPESQEDAGQRDGGGVPSNVPKWRLPQPPKPNRAEDESAAESGSSSNLRGGKSMPSLAAQSKEEMSRIQDTESESASGSKWKLPSQKKNQEQSSVSSNMKGSGGGQGASVVKSVEDSLAQRKGRQEDDADVGKPQGPASWKTGGAAGPRGSVESNLGSSSSIARSMPSLASDDGPPNPSGAAAPPKPLGWKRPQPPSSVTSPSGSASDKPSVPPKPAKKDGAVEDPAPSDDVPSVPPKPVKVPPKPFPSDKENPPKAAPGPPPKPVKKFGDQAGEGGEKESEAEQSREGGGGQDRGDGNNPPTKPIPSWKKEPPVLPPKVEPASKVSSGKPEVSDAELAAMPSWKADLIRARRG